ncbi:hypothetical protein [Crateriforma conspicua]|uniref:hypothetical protein n=1 Tax=Crateriforma conspicua TaxID=2527996 RepID=UPI00118A5157|nr:hypothetical protein [Crateriforma conspicua]QDV64612.1 hypothetical protein Mal65_37720 [Crateriforma conspicua]
MAGTKRRAQAKRTQVDRNTLAVMPLTTKEGEQIHIARTSRRVEKGTLLRLDYEDTRLVLRIADESILSEQY